MTSSPPPGCSTRWATSASRPPSSAPRGSCRPTPSRWRGSSRPTGSRPSTVTPRDGAGWHLLIGGTDPADLTRQAPDRIAHTHLKDVDDRIADKVRSGRLSYDEAVTEGMYTLEQDTVLIEEPRGEGPVTDVRTSADYVRALLERSLTRAPR